MHNWRTVKKKFVSRVDELPTIKQGKLNLLLEVEKDRLQTIHIFKFSELLPWSGVFYIGLGRLTNEPIERYAYSLPQKPSHHNIILKICSVEVFECGLLNSASFFIGK